MCTYLQDFRSVFFSSNSASHLGGAYNYLCCTSQSVAFQDMSEFENPAISKFRIPGENNARENLIDVYFSYYEVS
jgi:hypothetical protein